MSDLRMIFTSQKQTPERRPKRKQTAAALLSYERQAIQSGDGIAPSEC